jgi:phosphohistidine phosphatase
MASERKLYFLRHAKAEVASAGQPDHDRALTSRGISESRRIAQYFCEHQIDPEVILCSTAVRTRQTERELRAHHPLSAETFFLAELYLAPWEEIVKTVRSFAPSDAKTALVIGHNPGLEECAARLTGELVLLATGAMAMMDVKQADFDKLGADSCWLRGIVSAKSLPLEDD